MKKMLIQMTVILGISSVGHARDRFAESENPNIEFVRNFHAMVFVDHKTAEAAEKYLASSYIQHNPNMPTGRKAFVDFFEPFFKKNPLARAEIKRVVADGDLVMLHSHSKIAPSDKGRAIVDIFRVKDDRIVEHWDVIQAIPDNSANDNTMF